MSNKLLVASVFAPSDRNPTWLQLQRRFLAKTTTAYDHAVFLNREDPARFHGSIVIGRHSGDARGSEEHAQALRQILDYCRNHRYENYLILDSDCFPVCAWQRTLLSRMGAFPIAAAVRVENLDVFPHPCVFLIRGEAIHEPFLDFAVASCRNLLQQEVRDVGCGIPRDRCFPLLRTNVWNPHPILAAIYGHLFYHHGAGSRDAVTRALLAGYYDHILSPEAWPIVERELYRALMRDAERLIARLLGHGLVPGQGQMLSWLRHLARVIRRGLRKVRG